jgi:hypothetical protein
VLFFYKNGNFPVKCIAVTPDRDILSNDTRQAEFSCLQRKARPFRVKQLWSSSPRKAHSLFQKDGNLFAIVVTLDKGVLPNDI